MLIGYPPDYLVAILLTSFLRVLPAAAAEYLASNEKASVMEYQCRYFACGKLRHTDGDRAIVDCPPTTFNPERSGRSFSYGNRTAYPLRVQSSTFFFVSRGFVGCWLLHAAFAALRVVASGCPLPKG